jgi:hypothetical protein
MSYSFQNFSEGHYGGLGNYHGLGNFGDKEEKHKRRRRRKAKARANVLPPMRKPGRFAQAIRDVAQAIKPKKRPAPAPVRPKRPAPDRDSLMAKLQAMRGGESPSSNVSMPKTTAPLEVEEQVMVAKLPPGSLPPGIVSPVAEEPEEEAETEIVTQKVVAQPLVPQPIMIRQPMQAFPAGMPRPGMPRPGMPTRLPAPPVKPIITPQQARLGTIAAALGAGLLFF